MTKTLIAKPVIKNQYWIVTDGEEKVGNVISNGTGFEVKLNGNKTNFTDTKVIEKATNIVFQPVNRKQANKEIPFKDYPTVGKVYNSILDVKRKLHIYTKTSKSKCYYAAGWYSINQGENTEVILCPKYIFIQRYPYKGPFKTKEEAEKSDK